MLAQARSQLQPVEEVDGPAIQGVRRVGYRRLSRCRGRESKFKHTRWCHSDVCSVPTLIEHAVSTEPLLSKANLVENDPLLNRSYIEFQSCELVEQESTSFHARESSGNSDLKS